MKAIRIFPRFLSLRGDWLLEWGLGGEPWGEEVEGEEWLGDWRENGLWW